jgi:hypothetical protein
MPLGSEWLNTWLYSWVIVMSGAHVRIERERERERYKSQQNSSSQTDEWLQYKIFIYLEVIK